MIHNSPGFEPSPTHPEPPIGGTQILPHRPPQRAANRPVSTSDSQGHENPSRSGLAAVRAARASGRHLTIADVCAELGISRSTFYDWRAKRKAPPCFKLPNGDLRIRRTAFDLWLSGLEEEAA